MHPSIRYDRHEAIYLAEIKDRFYTDSINGRLFSPITGFI
jgi:hypothetical protein